MLSKEQCWFTSHGELGPLAQCRIIRKLAHPAAQTLPLPLGPWLLPPALQGSSLVFPLVSVIQVLTHYSVREVWPDCNFCWCDSVLFLWVLLLLLFVCGFVGLFLVSFTISYAFCKKKFEKSQRCLLRWKGQFLPPLSKKKWVDKKFNSFIRGKWNLLHEKGLRGLGL